MKFAYRKKPAPVKKINDLKEMITELRLQRGRKIIKMNDVLHTDRDLAETLYLEIKAIETTLKTIKLYKNASTNKTSKER